MHNTYVIIWHIGIIYLPIHRAGNGWGGGRSRERVIEKRDRVQTDNPVGNNRFDERSSVISRVIPTRTSCSILLWLIGGFLRTLRTICVSRIAFNAYISSYYCVHVAPACLLSLYLISLRTSLSLRGYDIVMSAIFSIDCRLIGMMRRTSLF